MSPHLPCLLVFGLVGLMTCPGPLAAQDPPSAAAPAKPVALVLSNWKYSHLAPLLTPEADLEVMRSTLTALRPAFEVTAVPNGTRAAMLQAIAEFTRAHAGKSVVLVYFSGHGVQAGNRNYLAPVDADLADFEAKARTLAATFSGEQRDAYLAGLKESYARDHLVSVDDLIDTLGRMSPAAARDHVKMVFLDACRDPIPDAADAPLVAAKTAFGGKSGGGLARVSERPGIFVGMSAAANQVSQQSPGRLVLKSTSQAEAQALGAARFLMRHFARPGSRATDVVEELPPSLFTEHLTAQMQAGGNLEEVFNRAGEAVFTATQTLVEQGQIDSVQTPAKYSLLYRDFDFGEASSLREGHTESLQAALAQAQRDKAVALRQKAEAEAQLAAASAAAAAIAAPPKSVRPAGGTGGTMVPTPAVPGPEPGHGELGTTSREDTVRGFFRALGDRDEAGVTRRLSTVVDYYGSGALPRAKVLEDIRGDWKRYRGAEYRVLDFQPQGQHECRFVLEYEMREGERLRQGRLSMSAVVSGSAIARLKMKILSAE